MENKTALSAVTHANRLGYSKKLKIYPKKLEFDEKF